MNSTSNIKNNLLLDPIVHVFNHAVDVFNVGSLISIADIKCAMPQVYTKRPATSMLAVALMICTLPIIALLTGILSPTTLVLGGLCSIGLPFMWLSEKIHSEVLKIMISWFIETHQSLPTVENDPRPVMLILQATEDHNGALEQRRERVLLLEKDYRIVYKTVSSGNEFRNALETLTEKVDVLWIRAHGNPKGISLGQNECLEADSLNQYSDLFKQRLAENATIILESCSTAGSRKNNLPCFAEKLASSAAGKTVIAARREIHFAHIRNNGKLNVRFGRFNLRDLEFGLFRLRNTRLTAVFRHSVGQSSDNPEQSSADSIGALNASRFVFQRMNGQPIHLNENERKRIDDIKRRFRLS